MYSLKQLQLNPTDPTDRRFCTCVQSETPVLGLHNTFKLPHRVFRSPFYSVRQVFCIVLYCLGDGAVLYITLIEEDASNLRGPHAAEEEVDSCQPVESMSIRRLMGSNGSVITYRIFLGLIMKHHRVHISPVAVRARFCVRESFSAGLAKSLIPAITIAHWGLIR